MSLEDATRPPTPQEARGALGELLPDPRLVDTRRERVAWKVVQAFIDHHDGCQEREASLVLALEEQNADERDLW